MNTGSNGLVYLSRLIFPKGSPGRVPDTVVCLKRKTYAMPEGQYLTPVNRQQPRKLDISPCREKYEILQIRIEVILVLGRYNRLGDVIVNNFIYLQHFISTPVVDPGTGEYRTHAACFCLEVSDFPPKLVSHCKCQ